MGNGYVAENAPFRERSNRIFTVYLLVHIHQTTPLFIRGDKGGVLHITRLENIFLQELKIIFPRCRFDNFHQNVERAGCAVRLFRTGFKIQTAADVEGDCRIQSRLIRARHRREFLRIAPNPRSMR